MWAPVNKLKLPQVTGKASSGPDELSFVILRTSSVETAEIASLLEAEVRRAHHRYNHFTATSPATCLAVLEVNPATHGFVVFDDVLGDIWNIVLAEPRNQRTLENVAKSDIIEFCASRRIHCTFFSHGNFYQHDERNCFYDRGFKEEAEPNIELLSDPLNTYDFHQVSTAATLSCSNSCNGQYPARSYEKDALLLRLRLPIWDHSTRRFLQNFEHEIPVAVNKHNSWSVLHDILPAAVFLAIHKVTGRFNFTNPGTMTNYNVMALLQDKVKPKARITMAPDLDPTDA